jgi:TRAP-type C4-dicarboxylate transport system substrate-binding protein
MTTRRQATSLMLTPLLPAALSHNAQAQATTTLLFNSFIQGQHPVNTRILRPWADDIAKASGGRLKLDIPLTSLAAPPQQLDGVMKGVFDMAYQFHGFLAPKIKLTQVAHLPGVNTTARGSSIALWRTYEKFFKQANEFKDVHLLGLFLGLPGPVFGMKGPVNSVADLKGVKTYGLPGVVAKLMEGAGAGVVAAPAVRSHEVISGGTVDIFAGYSVMDAQAFKTLQYAKAVTDFPGHLSAPAFALFVNKAKWAGLPAADREVLTKFGGEELSRRFAVYDELEAKARADAAAAGVTFSNATPAFAAEIRKLAEPLEQAWLADAKAAGVDGPAALAYYKQQALENAK